MRKGTWIGSLAVVLGLGYVVGVFVTAEQVKTQYERYVAALSENYRGVAKISSTTDASFFSANNKLVMEFQDLPETVLKWANTNRITFDINFTHGFLDSDSVLTIAKGELLEKIKSHQQLREREPLLIASNFSYDLIASKVKVVGSVDLDGLKYRGNGVELHIGRSTGPYTMLGDRFEFNLSSQVSRLKVADIEFKIGQSYFQQHAVAVNGDIIAAGMVINSETKINIDKLEFLAPTGELLVDNLKLNMLQHIKGDRAALSANYQAQLLRTNNGQDQYQFDNPEIDMMIDLDLAALIDFVKGLKDLQQSGAANLENPIAILPLLNGIAGKGMGLDINRLSLSYAGETLEGKAQLKLAPFAIEEFMQNHRGVIQKVDLKASLVMPKKLLAVFPGFDPQQLGFAIAMGFIIEEIDLFRFDLTAKEGKIELNGNPLPGL